MRTNNDDRRIRDGKADLTVDVISTWLWMLGTGICATKAVETGDLSWTLPGVFMVVFFIATAVKMFYSWRAVTAAIAIAEMNRNVTLVQTVMAASTRNTGAES